MNPKLKALVYSILFLGVSIYFGTGWSTVIFNFPVLPQLDVSNYYLHFVPEVAAATSFFTVLVPVMLVACVVMAIAEWKTRLRWVPIVVFLAICSASSVTMFLIFPINKEMAQHITDPQQLAAAISRWVFLTKIRVVFWSTEWVTMMYFFACQVLAGERS